MAGIEKICEFSGDYPGGLMYGYKRNHIQICPKYRKLFRGADAYVEITDIVPHFVGKTGWSSSDIEHFEFVGARGKVKNEYWYTLVVSDPELAGEVGGRYLNYTYNLRQTLKRLKRMLRCRNLKVKVSKGYIDEQNSTDASFLYRF
jgi:hypothetical protein